MSKQTNEFIRAHKIIAICRRIYGAPLLELAKALRAGGIRLIEVTFDQSAADCEGLTCHALRSLREGFPDMLIGAGTVLSKTQAQAAAGSGADYIVAPNTAPDVIEAARGAGLSVIPGATTPNEIITAHNLGADFVKLFPCASLGLAYARDIVAPLSHIGLIAASGITADNLADYLSLGFIGAGISSVLCNKALLAEKRFDEITRTARDIMRIAQG